MQSFISSGLQEHIHPGTIHLRHDMGYTLHAYNYDACKSLTEERMLQGRYYDRDTLSCKAMATCLGYILC